MQAVMTQTRSDATGLAPSERRAFARASGGALATILLAIIVQQVGPMLVAGQRVTGTSDVGAIRAFYGHHGLQFFWGLSGLGFVAMVVFAVSFRTYLRTFRLTPIESLVLDCGTAAMLLEAPLIAVEIALQAALVQTVASGTDNGVLALFAGWDWIYNGSAYSLEATWMAVWAFVALRTRALPRWVGITGGAAAVGLLFNSSVLTFRVPDNFTLIPTALLAAWMVGSLIHLLGGRAQD